MNQRLILSTAVATFGLWSGGIAAPNACESIAKRVQADCTARPERVLVVVEDGVVQSEGCACEIVKAAIVGASANSKLVGEIVFTAASSAPTAATTIAECALAAAPDASAEVKSGLKRALGDKAAEIKPSSAPAPTPETAPDESIAEETGETPVGKGPVGKSPAGKTVITPARDLGSDDDVDWGLSPIAIGGVYLVYPSAGGARQVDDCECDDRVAEGSRNGRARFGSGTGGGNSGKDGKRKRNHPPARVVIPPVTAGDSNTPTPDNTPIDTPDNTPLPDQTPIDTPADTPAANP